MGIDTKVLDQANKQKGNSECLPWEFIKKYFFESKNNERVSNMYAITVYGMVIFPKVLDHVEATVVDLVEQVNS